MALMMLGMHQDVQQKVMDEINEIYMSEACTDYTMDFLHKFSYLEAVIKETMRLFPEAPIIARESSEEVDINGYLIPKGTNILISIIGMHRDEKYWGSDALKFKPERFLEELEHPMAFTPFSGEFY
jgi:cytochrome P450